MHMLTTRSLFPTAEGNRCLFTMRIAPIGANNANQGRPVYLCEDILLPNARREDLIE